MKTIIPIHTLVGNTGEKLIALKAISPKIRNSNDVKIWHFCLVELLNVVYVINKRTKIHKIGNIFSKNNCTSTSILSQEPEPGLRFQPTESIIWYLI